MPCHHLYNIFVFILIYNLTLWRTFTSKVLTDDSRLLQELNLTTRQPRRTPHHVIQATMSEGLGIRTSDLPHQTPPLGRPRPYIISSIVFGVQQRQTKGYTCTLEKSTLLMSASIWLIWALFWSTARAACARWFNDVYRRSICAKALTALIYNRCQ